MFATPPRNWTKGSGNADQQAESARTTSPPSAHIEDNRSDAASQNRQQQAIQRNAHTQLQHMSGMFGKSPQPADIAQRARNVVQRAVPASSGSGVIQLKGKEELQLEIDGWTSPVAKALMADVLDQSSASAAADKVYSNIFAHARNNWSYKAAHGGSNGKTIIDGGGTVGMCETYRNAFRYMLENYVIPLTQDYAPFSDGFTVAEGQALTNTKFVTKPSLALLGRSSGYNVSQELDASTGATKAARHYLFSSHWQLIVNGKTYDPLFEGDPNASQWVINKLSDTYYSSNEAGVAFVANSSAGPTSGGEFGGQYVLVRNADDLETAVKNSDDVKYAHQRMSEVRDGMTAIKSKWLEVMGWYYGKTSWHNKMKTDNATPWVAKLEELRSRERTIPGNDLLSTLTSEVSRPILETAHYQAGVAKKAIDKLLATDETSEMGAHLDTAIEALAKALGSPVIKDM